MSETESRAQRARRKRKEDRRQALKTAAIEIFSEKGYHQAKVSDIVERVGVAQGTFYLYYEGKQPLFGELLEDFLTLVVEAAADWDPAALQSRDDLRDELTRIGLVLTDVLQANRGLTAIFFREAAAVAQEFATAVREFYETLATMMTIANEVLCERGLIAPMNFRLLALATVGQIERVIAAYVVGDTINHVDPKELVDHLVMLFLDGTTRPIPTTSRPSPEPSPS